MVLLKRRDMHEDVCSSKGKEQIVDCEDSELFQKDILTKYCNWLKECYEEFLGLLLNAIEFSVNESIAHQALTTYMKLLQSEAKYHFYNQIESTDDNKIISNLNALYENDEMTGFPVVRLKYLLQCFTSGHKRQTAVISQFRLEYLKYLDVVWHCWYLLQLPQLISRTSLKNELSALNVLDLINSLPILTEPMEKTTNTYFCHKIQETNIVTNTEKPNRFNEIVEFVNIIWHNVISSFDGGRLSYKIHQKLLLILIRQIMKHLKQPLELTDFLMDSMDIGKYYLLKIN